MVSKTNAQGLIMRIRFHMIDFDLAAGYYWVDRSDCVYTYGYQRISHIQTANVRMEIKL